MAKSGVYPHSDNTSHGTKETIWTKPPNKYSLVRSRLRSRRRFDAIDIDVAQPLHDP